VLSEVQALQNDEKHGTSAYKLALSKPQPRWYKILEAKLLKKLGISSKHAEKRIIHTDDLLIKIASELECPVVTSDKRLIQKLHASGINTISLRGKKYLKLSSPE
jgi:rRNA-processing protein FCF1